MEIIMNNLDVVWFILVCVLFSGFFVLEGFDYGVGILLPFLGKTDVERRQMINTVGPVWDGNQVWMITAGGATFASFPHVYATLFSGFYLALFLMLAALIARGVAFEFRSKDKSLAWRKTFDYCIFFGSLIPALLWGVTVGNLIQGTPIDGSMNFVGGFFDLLSPYTILCGVAFILVFVYHGALYTSLKTLGDISERARALALVEGVITAVGALVLVGATYVYTDLFNSTLATICYAAAIVLFIVSWVCTRARRVGWGFTFSVLTIISITAAYFAGLFPRIMVSSLNPAYSLTITNASSSQYTLTLMTIVALIFVPIVLAYQAWTYWTFRHRIGVDDLHY
ncbi:MAG: cytochrome d ubiquinol oxidase subunit II [Veillonella sp.]|uniref:cytochrome d ubiquinol oxidase subunit II n=1 Tax=Veillonella sp. TaxID=1926307 RepID=UPI0025DB7F3D|nr:cytochrome d ubiquinol oxidase subunit II [Veillonella sp.]MBS4914150.1 cytochrome d ubiquinol oxidase subunit II [Veillonella sp.]